MHDLRFAFRQLLKNPGFTAVAVLTLALGIGANTAIFSIVNAVLLRPLPYPESHRLLSLCERGRDWSGGAIAYPNFVDWKAQQSVFENLGVFTWENFTLTGAGDPVQLSAARMSADVFAALRIQPVLGRTFAPDEDKPGAPAVAVISHAIWQSRFSSDPALIDRAINLDGRPYTVIGVMPRNFAFPNAVDVWMPVGPASANKDWQDRGNHPGLLGLARLKRGVTMEQANADLEAIAIRLEQAYPQSNKNRRVQVETLLDNRVSSVRRSLWTLLGAVAFVLLIACANVANLLLTRAVSRQKEMAVRVALGAGRWRIIRQLLAESLVLAVIGAGAGLLLAEGALRLVRMLGHFSIPRVEEIGLDTTVLLFSAGVAVVTGILFGVAPAWTASRPDLQEALKDGSRGSSGRRGRLRQGLVAAEVGLTLVLLVGAGLLMRSFDRLLRVNPGFAYERVLTFRTNLPERKYSSNEQQIQFFEALLEKVRSLPGVEAASLASQIPLDQNGWDTSFLVEGRPEPPPHERPSLQVHIVDTDYFRAMGIPLQRGRDFMASDNREHLRGGGREDQWGSGLNAIIVDESFARRHLPNEDPIGQKIRLPWAEKREEQPVLTVVGVVGRVKEDRLTEKGGMVQAYFPFQQRPLRGMAVIVKTTQEPATLLNTIRREVLSLDPEQPVYEVQTLSEMRARDIAPQRLNLALLGLFATVALALAVVGLYGVLAYAVTQRRREIGVRMALGAQTRDVLRVVLGEGMRLAMWGAIFGLVGAIACGRVLEHLLFETPPTDVATLFVVTILLLAIAAIACWIPARRASRVNPIEALRYE